MIKARARCVRGSRLKCMASMAASSMRPGKLSFAGRSQACSCLRRRLAHAFPSTRASSRNSAITRRYLPLGWDTTGQNACHAIQKIATPPAAPPRFLNTTSMCKFRNSRNKLGTEKKCRNDSHRGCLSRWKRRHALRGALRERCDPRGVNASELAREGNAPRPGSKPNHESVDRVFRTAMPAPAILALACPHPPYSSVRSEWSRAGRRQLRPWAIRRRRRRRFFLSCNRRRAVVLTRYSDPFLERRRSRCGWSLRRKGIAKDPSAAFDEADPCLLLRSIGNSTHIPSIERPAAHTTLRHATVVGGPRQFR